MISDGEKRFEKCWGYFNPPKRLLNATFDSYFPVTNQQKKALEACREYNIDNILSGKGLLLVGEYGTGKTHLSIAIVKTLMNKTPDIFGVRQDMNLTIYDPLNTEYHGLYCSFFSTIELLDALRPGSEAKQIKADDLFHRARADHLIILDDIGAEKPTEWVAERLYAIIDARYRMERATIFTSNLSEKQLQDQLGGRIVSRIFEMTDQVPVIGPDHRRKMA